MIVFYRKLSFLFFFMLFSCSDDVSNISNQSGDKSLTIAEQSVEGVSYKVVSSEKTIMDYKSPLGEWTVSVSYPEIEGEIKENAKSKVNNAIIALSKKYKCRTNGEYTFTADVKFINSAVFSMNFEAMWYCPPMASPDSTTGAVTFNLNTGNQIVLESQFVDKNAENTFSKLILTKIKTQINVSETCSTKEMFDYFYKVKGGLVFVFDASQHADSGCISDIYISNKELSNYLKPGSYLLK